MAGLTKNARTARAPRRIGVLAEAQAAPSNSARTFGRVSRKRSSTGPVRGAPASDASADGGDAGVEGAFAPTVPLPHSAVATGDPGSRRPVVWTSAWTVGPAVSSRLAGRVAVPGAELADADGHGCAPFPAPQARPAA